MAKLRTPLHLVLALILLSLTCDVGAVCAAAMEGDCCCMMADGSTPCTDMSDGEDAPGAPESAATIDGGRFSVAVLTAAVMGQTPVDTPPGPDGRPRLATGAAATPLYLSHCAFLC